MMIQANVVWAKGAGGSGIDGGTGIAADSSGNSYVTGYFSNSITFGSDTLTSSGSSDIFVVKLDACINYYTSQSPAICNGQSITVGSNTYTTSGTYIDTLIAFNGCDSIVTTNLTVNTSPATPVTISGDSNLCSGTTHTYSISSVSSATDYTWSVPSGAIINSGQGTTSINVTFGTNSGDVSVTADNACGSSSAQALSITIDSIPAQPGTISGIQLCVPVQRIHTAYLR
jgi:hypothetical protein